jgi:hypothetical protein
MIRLLGFLAILMWFAAAWASVGIAELVAFLTGVAVAVLAALIAASPNGGQ